MMHPLWTALVLGMIAGSAVGIYFDPTFGGVVLGASLGAAIGAVFALIELALSQ